MTAADASEHDPAPAADALKQALTRPLVLIGLMGAGKSSIGRRLAQVIGLPFADVDAEIEKAAGQSVADIFSHHGETGFRDGERKVMLRLLDRGPQVLAAGGGAFMDPETRAGILDKAISVWLKADLDVLMERVLRRDDRPLLQVDDPRRVMEKLMRERTPVYGQADLTVASTEGPHEAVVARIIEGLNDYLRAAP